MIEVSFVTALIVRSLIDYVFGPSVSCGSLPTIISKPLNKEIIFCIILDKESKVKKDVFGSTKRHVCGGFLLYMCILEVSLIWESDKETLNCQNAFDIFCFTWEHSSHLETYINIWEQGLEWSIQKKYLVCIWLGEHGKPLGWRV